MRLELFDGDAPGRREEAIWRERPAKGSLSGDWLVPLLLVSLRDAPARGYELRRSILGLGLRRVRESTLYRALRRMEEEGLLDSGPPGAEPRLRRYAITGSGEAYLDCMAGALEQYRDEIDAFLRVCRPRSLRRKGA